MNGIQARKNRLQVTENGLQAAKNRLQAMSRLQAVEISIPWVLAPGDSKENPPASIHPIRVSIMTNTSGSSIATDAFRMALIAPCGTKARKQIHANSPAIFFKKIGRIGLTICITKSARKQRHGGTDTSTPRGGAQNAGFSRVEILAKA